jgi:hypothetical protein
MRGMTLDEFKEVVEFVQKYHKFGYVKKEDRIQIKGEDHFMMIKYIDSCYYSRCQTIWVVTLRHGNTGYRFSSNHYAATNLPPAHFTFTSLFDWVMAFLKGEWTNRNILKECMIDNK